MSPQQAARSLPGGQDPFNTPSVAGEWPRRGEDIRRADVLAPTMESLIRFNGSPGAPVRGVTLEDARAWAQADPYVAAGVYAAVDVTPFRKVLP